ncbi:hypothetical protein BU25DRAFT_494773 [Macroventuria anomochaeta]|uniref:Uncharacterized protein n=1 Tax=Macroventuria anomochaeta TaxID=301207 RepID=A0ACB6RMB0_9PLEO|nr:uncharacterized protein BU25DRAFT_494773 [Macroventuria anomochaeta]KAF2622924.1 hypothetical protein BU25DRAFT_494773 [Macroventuria anomochaeta]
MAVDLMLLTGNKGIKKLKRRTELQEYFEAVTIGLRNPDPEYQSLLTIGSNDEISGTLDRFRPYGPTILKDHSYPGIQGCIIQLGAGERAFEIMAADRDKGLVVVGGECPTVGITGGYTQGRGHSEISTSFGLAADNNSDLYLALNGGGGSTYGVVVSMTVKAHKETVFGGASLSFFAADNAQDVFYDAIQAFHEELPAMADADTMVVHYFTSSLSMILPLNAYNKTEVLVKTILAPFVARLDAKKLNYTVSMLPCRP